MEQGLARINIGVSSRAGTALMRRRAIWFGVFRHVGGKAIALYDRPLQQRHHHYHHDPQVERLLSLHRRLRDLMEEVSAWAFVSRYLETALRLVLRPLIAQ